LTEIYLCGVCSCQEILRRNGRGQAIRLPRHAAAAAAASTEGEGQTPRRQRRRGQLRPRPPALSGEGAAAEQDSRSLLLSTVGSPGSRRRVRHAHAQAATAIQVPPPPAAAAHRVCLNGQNAVGRGVGHQRGHEVRGGAAWQARVRGMQARREVGPILAPPSAAGVAAPGRQGEGGESVLAEVSAALRATQVRGSSGPPPTPRSAAAAAAAAALVSLPRCD
jgi:hypothetical protein